jgi:hypothetical protein
MPKIGIPQILSEKYDINKNPLPKVKGEDFLTEIY